MRHTAPVRNRPPSAGSLPTSERVLGPDLARGFALLLVALAHGTGIVNRTIPGVDLSPHGLERPYLVVLVVFAHACALPLFSMMFGYGLVQFARRREALGVPPARTRAALLRRHGCLLVLAAAHGILLFVGDVLGAFALVGLAFTVVLTRRGAWIPRLGLGYLAFAACYVAVLAVQVYLSLAEGTDPARRARIPVGTDTTLDLRTYGDAVASHLREWPQSTLLLLTTGLFALAGAWAARRRILEEPAKYRRLLYAGLVGGFGIDLVAALPMGLLAGGYVHLDATAAAAAKHAYEGGGLFGAIGYLSLFGLIGHHLATRKNNTRGGAFTRALVALGQRSLSFYLLQSVVWLVLLSPFALDLSRRAGSPTFLAAGCAAGVWVFSLVAASLMHRRGFRGPVELVIRRVTYGARERARPQ